MEEPTTGTAVDNEPFDSAAAAVVVIGATMFCIFGVVFLASDSTVGWLGAATGGTLALAGLSLGLIPGVGDAFVHAGERTRTALAFIGAAIVTGVTALYVPYGPSSLAASIPLALGFALLAWSAWSVSGGSGSGEEDEDVGSPGGTGLTTDLVGQGIQDVVDLL